MLFNNAGIILVKPMLDVTEDDWDRIMNVNLRTGQAVNVGRPGSS